MWAVFFVYLHRSIENAVFYISDHVIVVWYSIHYMWSSWPSLLLKLYYSSWSRRKLWLVLLPLSSMKLDSCFMLWIVVLCFFLERCRRAACHFIKTKKKKGATKERYKDQSWTPHQYITKGGSRDQSQNPHTAPERQNEKPANTYNPTQLHTREIEDSNLLRPRAPAEHQRPHFSLTFWSTNWIYILSLEKETCWPKK